MTEEDEIRKHLAGIRQHGSLLYHAVQQEREEHRKKLEEKDLENKKLREENQSLRKENEEVREMASYAMTYDLVTHPTLLVRPDNTIQLANEKIQILSQYDLTAMLNRSLTDYVRGVEFLDQIRLDPVLMQVEDLHALAHVPVALVTKEGVELPLSAEINFLPPPRVYNGVRLALKPKEGRTLLLRTRQHVPRYLGGVTNYDAFDAEEYAQNHRLVVRDTPVEKSASLDGTHLLTEITKKVLEIDKPKHTSRRVIVNLRTVEECDSRFYQTLRAISQMNGLPLTCIVYEDSQVYQALIKEGFPETHIVKERRKKK